MWSSRAAIWHNYHFDELFRYCGCNSAINLRIIKFVYMYAYDAIELNRFQKSPRDMQ